MTGTLQLPSDFVLTVLRTVHDSCSVTVVQRATAPQVLKV